MHKQMSHPNPIRILERLGEPVVRKVSHVPTAFGIYERINKSPKTVDRLPRTVGMPMQANHIRRRDAVLRGLRKPSSNAWDRCVASEWKASEWRNGRLLANDPVVEKRIDHMPNLFKDNTTQLPYLVLEEDVWWRRPTLELANNLMDDDDVDDGDVNIDNKDTLRSEESFDFDLSINYSPELFSDSIIVNTKEKHSEFICNSMRRKHRSKLKWLHKRQLIAMPFVEPAPCLPSYDTLWNAMDR